MAEQEIIKLIESFNVSFPTIRARNQNIDELLYNAMNIVNKDGGQDLFSVLGSTGNRFILDTFLELDFGFTNEEIRETIAGNLNAPIEILDALSKESDNIQMELLSNPTTTKDTLYYLSRYGKSAGIKTVAKQQLMRRKFKLKSENVKLAKGEISFTLKDSSYISLPPENELGAVSSVQVAQCSFVTGKEYSPRTIDYLAKNETKAYLARMDPFAPTTRIDLLLEIERTASNEYKIVRVIDKSFNLDELK